MTRLKSWRVPFNFSSQLRHCNATRITIFLYFGGCIECNENFFLPSSEQSSPNLTGNVLRFDIIVIKLRSRAVCSVYANTEVFNRARHHVSAGECRHQCNPVDHVEWACGQRTLARPRSWLSDYTNNSFWIWRERYTEGSKERERIIGGHADTKTLHVPPCSDYQSSKADLPPPRWPTQRGMHGRPCSSSYSNCYITFLVKCCARYQTTNITRSFHFFYSNFESNKIIP